VCFEGADLRRVGVYPASIACADLNGDGAPDLVTANYTGAVLPGTVSVLLNLGDGTFAPQAVYDAGLSPYGVAAADFDGDGYIDLAVSKLAGPQLSLFRNQGNGTFGPLISMGPTSPAFGVTFADINGDGLPDIAAAAIPPGSTSYALVYFNQGSGTFAPAQSFAVGNSPAFIASADLDGNGSADLITANQGGDSVSVLLNQGAGSFATHADYPVGVEPTSIAIADLDGDGDRDLAVLNSGVLGLNASLSLLLNQGNGTFVPQPVLLAVQSLRSVAAVDLDADGDADLAVGQAVASLLILVNQGNGNFAAPLSFPCANVASAMTSGDLDGDAGPDLAIARWNWRSVVTLRNCTGIASSFCAGDGTVGPCPCANSGLPGHGCENSATTGGAILSASGSPSLANDTLVLSSAGELPSVASVFIQGRTTIAPVDFGDGLRCVAGSLKRLFVRTAVAGVVVAPVSGDPSICARSLALGDQILPGTPRYYQTYYRDPVSSSCPQGNQWNVSSAVTVHWTQ
jgi:hypothetical protein